MESVLASHPHRFQKRENRFLPSRSVAYVTTAIVPAGNLNRNLNRGQVSFADEPGVVWTDLRECLPEFVIDALRESVKPLGQQLRGFAMDEAVLTGVETRSSSPLRIPRDPETRECLGVGGFYPAGEGAGYAGGIISAAADGMKVAEGILRSPQMTK